MREKELTKNNDRLAVIRTCNRITILTNNSIEAEGYLDNEIPYKSTPSIIQSTDLAEHKDISTETTLLNYNYKYPSASIELFGKMVILLQVLMTASLSLFLVNSFSLIDKQRNVIYQLKLHF
jgi:hypothetical protein